ncbi:MAG: hypothetical protein JSV84_07620 [Gemmatimonadota bacterium]|nr:MAG: hypothetical protein JSV84_07620 [Gemmatimonadota bacterium]
MKHALTFCLSLFFGVCGVCLGQLVNVPPSQPTVTAVTGDGTVTLYWDDQAEESVDSLWIDPDSLSYRKDFEGYNIYRSTEPSFEEVRTITDGFGDPIYYKPIAQFDLKNGIRGPHPIDVNGVQFYLGDDTGLVHIWTDSTATNGQTYYYAVCAYDQGHSDLGLPPSENSKSITIDDFGNPTFVDRNCAVVTPNPPAAGYTPPYVESDLFSPSALMYVEYINYDTEEMVDYEYQIVSDIFLYPAVGSGTGVITVEIVDPIKLKEDHIYHIAFQDTGFLHQTTGYSVYDATFSPPDTLIEKSTYIKSKYIQEVTEVPVSETVTIRELRGPMRAERELGPFFDGMSLMVFNHPAIVYADSLSGWIVGDCNYEVSVGLDADLRYRLAFPADFEIRFYDHIVDTSVLLRPQPTNFEVFNVTDSVRYDFIFRDRDEDSLLTSGDAVYPVIYDYDENSDYERLWKISFAAPSDTILYDTTYVVTYDTTTIPPDSVVILPLDTLTVTTPIDTIIVPKIPPEPGDVWFLHTTKPFRTGDVFEFTTKAAHVDRAVARSELDMIAVVPNPYPGAASWEGKNSSGTQERRIYFIHLPQRATIRIYTISGYLVDTIEHEGTVGDGAEPWDLVSHEGKEIAYGIYIYHIDAPGIGEKIGKFAVIK